MAKRDLTTYRTVLPDARVEADTDPGIFDAVADVGQHIIRQSQDAKILENTSSARLELGQAFQDYQIKAQADPLNEATLKEYKSNRQSILNNYGSNISPLFRGDWQKQAASISERNDAQMQAWGYEQAAKNTRISVENTIEMGLKEANAHGLGGMSDAQALAEFAASHKNIREYAARNLGEVDAGEVLKSYERDYLKSYLAGKAEGNPQDAARIIDSDAFKEQFTTEERSEFASVIKKSQALRKFQSLMSQEESGHRVFDIVNSPDMSYYEKRVAIDKMEFSGNLPTSIASKARRLLKSENELNSVTSTPVISDIITRVYDLNASQEIDSEGYLEGVQNIREEIIEKQADGELTSTDAVKLNNQLKTLTSAKMADATQTVGMEFYDTKQKFDMLPPEYRGRATRDLFYRTQGKENVGKETYERYADDIITRINHERRANTLKRVDVLNMPDTDFIQSKGYTMDQVKQAATNKNISEAEVIRLLKAKVANEVGNKSAPVILKRSGEDSGVVQDDAAVIRSIFEPEMEDDEAEE